jgi:hypothetical protein
MILSWEVSRPVSRFLESMEQQGRRARQTQFAKGMVQSLGAMPEVSNLDAHLPQFAHNRGGASNSDDVCPARASQSRAVP